MNYRFALITVAMMSLVGCGRADAPATPATTPAVFNAAGAPTVEISVPDMVCEEGCAVAVRKALAQQPGVKEVVVDFPNRTATVAIEPGQFDADQAIQELIEDYGYPNTRLKTADETPPTTDAASALEMNHDDTKDTTTP